MNQEFPSKISNPQPQDANDMRRQSVVLNSHNRRFDSGKMKKDDSPFFHFFFSFLWLYFFVSICLLTPSKTGLFN